MSSNLSLIFDNLINQLTQLQKIIKKTTIEEIDFNYYLQQVKKFQTCFFDQSSPQILIEFQQIKQQLKFILNQRISKLKKISLFSIDYEVIKSNTNCSKVSIDSDQSLRSLLKRQVMLLKAIQVKIINLSHKFKGNKQNMKIFEQNRASSQQDYLVLQNIIQQNNKIDEILSDNIKRADIGLDLIKQITQIQEDLKQNIVYCYYQTFRKCQQQIKKTLDYIKSIIEKFISVKPSPSPMFQLNTTYAISQNTPKKSILTQRIHKKPCEDYRQIFIRDFSEQELKVNLKHEFDLKSKHKEKKIGSNGVCYSGCNIF